MGFLFKFKDTNRVSFEMYKLAKKTNKPIWNARAKIYKEVYE